MTHLKVLIMVIWRQLRLTDAFYINQRMNLHNTEDFTMFLWPNLYIYKQNLKICNS